jgi:hypothetical protein
MKLSKYRILIGVCIVLLLAYLIGSNTGQPNGEDDLSLRRGDEIITESKRQDRKGPRKPPQTVGSVRKGKKFTFPSKSDSESNEEIEGTESNLEEKVKRYLDYLDAHDSPNVQELIQLGELAFDANDSASAYDHYLEVIEQHTDDPMAPYALYKFAWVEQNLGDNQAAIDDMSLVIEWTELEESQLDKKLLETAHEDLQSFQGN